jgi:hypothetical protein
MSKACKTAREAADDLLFEQMLDRYIVLHKTYQAMGLDVPNIDREDLDDIFF